MFTASIFEDIVEQERKVESKQIVILLFVRPRADNRRILEDFLYLHRRSGRYCNLYAVGYADSNAMRNNNERRNEYRRIDSIWRNELFFSEYYFVQFVEWLEYTIGWHYSGETELMVLQHDPESEEVVSFDNYVSINVDKGIRRGYIDSFQVLIDELIRSARNEVTAKEAIRDVLNSRINIPDIISNVIEECKRIPTPVRDILQDRLFYRCRRI